MNDREEKGGKMLDRVTSALDKNVYGEKWVDCQKKIDCEREKILEESKHRKESVNYLYKERKRMLKQKIIERMWKKRHAEK